MSTETIEGTMTLANHANQVDIYFQYKSLRKIHGESAYEAIKTKDEPQANASTISSEFGGGIHGHLGLVLQEEEYQRISNTPYKRLDYLGWLNIPMGTIQHESTRLHNEHKEAVKLFRENIDILKSQR